MAETFSLIQIAALIIGGSASAIFLFRYVKIVDLKHAAAKFLVSLNTTFIMVAVSSSIVRLYDNPVLQAINAVVLAVLSVVMGAQLLLLRISNSRAGEDRRSGRGRRHSDW